MSVAHTADFDEEGHLVDGGVEVPAPRFATVEDWVEGYFIHIVAGPYCRSETAGGRTWCAAWWDHPPVVAALHELWVAWEAARAADDPAALSAWWVGHLHPQVRWLCDGEQGPMYRCDKDRHTPLRHLQVIPVPDGWFDQTDTTVVGDAPASRIRPER